MANKSGKGSRYERELCEKLSTWWCGREDVFWRTAGSGARAKTRGRCGKGTYGQHGDICATDPVGDDLVRAITIEIKRGYSKNTIMDLLDRSKESAIQKWEEWLWQAYESHKHSGSLSWMIIFKRDRKQEMVVIPNSLYDRLGISTNAIAFMRFSARNKSKNAVVSRMFKICIISLDDFLDQIKPNHIKELL